jgi:hypothetical protein
MTKYGRAAHGQACIEHMGDVRVVHQGQSLLFSFEAGDHLFAVHSGLNDLEGYLALQRLLLLSQIYNSHTSFTQDFKKLITPDPASRLFQQKCFGAVLLCDSRVVPVSNRSEQVTQLFPVKARYRLPFHGLQKISIMKKTLLLSIFCSD